ncbi:hypothetical protein HKCCE2091_00810 [Rhodobacterales bacterium HKCCE2091]|nr:hypothetical protein [Rhodobacterales bacterium HKCCE2091]
MTDRIHVFALNEPVDVRHTELTRQKGEAPVLPPLHEWIGVDGIDTDRIELFPVSDLGNLALPDYLAEAHAVEPDALASVAARLRAVSGTVLIVPESALDGPVSPQPQAADLAILPVIEPDHGGHLDPVAIPAAPDPVVPPQSAGSGGRLSPRAIAIIVGVALVLAALLLWGIT